MLSCATSWEPTRIHLRPHRPSHGQLHRAPLLLAWLLPQPDSAPIHVLHHRRRLRREASGPALRQLLRLRRPSPMAATTDGRTETRGEGHSSALVLGLGLRAAKQRRRRAPAPARTPAGSATKLLGIARRNSQARALNTCSRVVQKGRAAVVSFVRRTFLGCAIGCIGCCGI
jgi:hypothetical protein